MTDKSYDVAIIGGGPGGYVAAIRASQLGLKAAVVEREHMGGICLNWGCIPTKALLRSSEINHLLHNLPEFGLSAEKPSFDFDAIIKRSRSVSAQLTKGIGMLMKKHKVDVHEA
ncbi:MAG: FAD-dependent oxidoreductase, partial [Ignavibacteriae bacterium]|nr:FAD-dependent oxidoreductase [Ignavibacteriota bacterium]